MIFTYQRTIRFQDTDAAGVVYFANTLSMCHEAYEESLSNAGINIKTFFTNPDVAFPIVHANIDFWRPIYCGDKLLISLIPQKISMEKFDIIYNITVDEVIVAKAITKHVCINSGSRTKQALPQKMIDWLEMNYRETIDVN